MQTNQILFREMTDEEYIASRRHTRLTPYEMRANSYLTFQHNAQVEMEKSKKGEVEGL